MACGALAEPLLDVVEITGSTSHPTIRAKKNAAPSEHLVWHEVSCDKDNRGDWIGGLFMKDPSSEVYATRSLKRGVGLSCIDVEHVASAFRSFQDHVQAGDND